MFIDLLKNLIIFKLIAFVNSSFKMRIKKDLVDSEPSHNVNELTPHRIELDNSIAHSNSKA
jgi:hypothetical protein